MLYLVPIAVGFPVGFVAGARAGRERYEQIKKFARGIVDNPAVQQAAGALRGQAGDLAQTAPHKAGDKLHDKIPGRRGTATGNSETPFPASRAAATAPA